MPTLAILLLAASVAFSGITVPASCHGLVPPSPGDVVRPYGPTGRWTGHFGVDVASPQGDAVSPIGDGVVTFAGTVVGNTAVTVDHGGGVRTTYSYLHEARVAVGTRVTRRSVVGVSGLHDDREAFHLSLRLGMQYIDPMTLARCSRVVGPALYLAAVPAPYPSGRARTSRRNLRSAARWPSCDGYRCGRSAGYSFGRVRPGR